MKPHGSNGLLKLANEHPTLAALLKLVRNPRVIFLESLFAFWLIPAIFSSVLSPDRKTQTASALAGIAESALRALIANPWAQLGYFSLAFYGIFWAASHVADQDRNRRKAAEREAADLFSKKIDLVIEKMTLIPNLVAKSWAISKKNKL